MAVYTQTWSADAVTPNGARPAAGTVMTEKRDLFSLQFRRLSMFLVD